MAETSAAVSTDGSDPLCDRRFHLFLGFDSSYFNAALNDSPPMFAYQ